MENAKNCEACQADAPQVPDDELAALMRAIPGWQPIVVDGVMQLQRVYRFANFAQAWDFLGVVAAMAEQKGHHPALLLEWGQLTVTWWSHKIRGLHRMDFECAAQTDALWLAC